jgi:hypothetical protein
MGIVLLWHMHDDSFELACGWLDGYNHSRLTTARKLPPIHAGPALSHLQILLLSESHTVLTTARGVLTIALLFSLPCLICCDIVASLVILNGVKLLCKSKY